jgi:hypothetical protein
MLLSHPSSRSHSLAESPPPDVLLALLPLPVYDVNDG